VFSALCGEISFVVDFKGFKNMPEKKFPPSAR
jgi:hypothetical protein